MNRIADAAFVLAALLLALAYAARGLYLGALVAVGIGAVYVVAQRRAWRWSGEVGLLGFTALAAAGGWLGLPPLILLPAVVAALAGWDLLGVAQRARSVQRVEAAGGVVREHLLYLLGVCACALVLGALALGVEVPLGFGAAVALGALALGGLSYVLVVLRRNEIE